MTLRRCRSSATTCGNARSARKCLVGATTPIAKCMEVLRERTGITEAECRAIGHDNPLALIGMSR